MTGQRWVPPTVPIPKAFDRFDARVDGWFEEHLRGRPLADTVMYAASALGDHGLIWLALAGVQAGRRARSGAPWQRRLIATAGGLGIESAFVNGPVKWLFRRTRPVHEGPRPRTLRNPRTSSFPSGHATAAFFGAAVLSDEDRSWAPLYYTVAVVVAASRVHVKIHHASDVTGGILIGVGLGELGRRLVSAAAGQESRRARLGLTKG